MSGVRAIAGLVSVLFLLACSALGGARESVGSIYFIDGIDANDGMSAHINQLRGTIRVAGTLMQLKDCANRFESNWCLESDYFIFGLPKRDVSSWRIDDASFERGSQCWLLVPDGQRLGVLATTSQQKYGAFTFYTSLSGRTLFGWRLDDLNGSGELYLLEGSELMECEDRL